MSDTTKNLYPVRLWMLDPSSMCVVVSMPESGTVWAVPASVVVADAHRYYSREGWDEGVAKKKQPKGEELRGLLWANPDFAQWFKEMCWEDAEPHAILLAGEGENPGNDTCWWFEEHGGLIEEATTQRAQKPWRGALLVCDAKEAFETDEPLVADLLNLRLESYRPGSDVPRLPALPAKNNMSGRSKHRRAS